MEISANYITLGPRRGAGDEAPRIFPVPNRPAQVHDETPGADRPRKVIGKTPEERKRIAREIRLRMKKEHKKSKQEAKAARKENGILHRRMNRNDAKYSKNKERNEKRDIDMERRAIQEGAVKQAELLASIHDPSGRRFNVGKIVVMPNGQIKSKTRLREQEEIRARRAEEIAAMEAKVKRAEEAFIDARTRKETELAAKGMKITSAHVEMLRERYPIPPKISKTQMAKREANAYRPPPPRPIIPKEFSVPEGEEDLLALWDITDSEIKQRIERRKREKTIAAKSLRRLQKEKKKFNCAVKAIKKQCASAGVAFDPEAAKKEVLGMISDASNSDSDDEDDSDSDSDSDFDDTKESNTDKTATAMKLKGTRPKIDLELLAQANAVEAARELKKREKKDKRRQERKAQAAKEAAKKAQLQEEEQSSGAVETDKSSTKRKRVQDTDSVEADVGRAEKKARKAEKKAGKIKVEVKVEDVAMVSKPEEPVSSKRKRTVEPVLNASNEKERKKSKKAEKTSTIETEPIAEDDEAEAKRERKEARKAKKAAEESSTTINTEPVPCDDEAKAKRERKEVRKAKSKPVPAADDLDLLDRVIATHDAKMKASTVSADQWNPEALGGDDARKSKFMRLLGAGKGAAGGVKEGQKRGEKDAKKTAEQISKVQSELERQYESGMKMKHDGGGKRRGLGA